MTVIEMKPLSLIEAKNIVEAVKEGEEKEIKTFLKKFIKLDTKETKKLREELESLDILKMKEEHIVKIIDLLPEDAFDINKIFADVSLDENEISKLLEIVKKYK